jgi:uncharacterized protein
MTRPTSDRLLWETKQLFEWNAYVWPVEDLPLVKGLIAGWRRSTRYAKDRWIQNFLTENRSFRRYVLRTLDERGPLLSRELEDRSVGESRDHRWYGARKVGLMLMSLHLRGEIAIAGRRGGQRLWDLAERWYPAGDPLSPRAASCQLAEKRFQAIGVGLTADGWEAHADAEDGPVPDRVTLLSPFDRLIHDRDRVEALFGFHYRLEMYVPKAKRKFGYYVLPILRGDQLIGRLEPIFARKSGALNVTGVWAEPGAPADAGPDVATALRELAAWLGAREIAVAKKRPRAWARALDGI